MPYTTNDDETLPMGYQVSETYKYTIGCTHPETGKVGSWLFSGSNAWTPGTTISPVFSTYAELVVWLWDNGYRAPKGGAWNEMALATGAKP
jgi:hypothetical protein